MEGIWLNYQQQFIWLNVTQKSLNNWVSLEINIGNKTLTQTEWHKCPYDCHINWHYFVLHFHVNLIIIQPFFVKEITKLMYSHFSASIWSSTTALNLWNKSSMASSPNWLDKIGSPTALMSVAIIAALPCLSRPMFAFFI